MTTQYISKRHNLIDLITTAFPHNNDKTIKAVMTVDDDTLSKKYAAWDNAIYLVLGGDTKAVQNAIDEELEIDPMYVLFNEQF